MAHSVIAAGAPPASSPQAATLATAVATAAQQNPTAAAQVIASASSRAQHHALPCKTSQYPHRQTQQRRYMAWCFCSITSLRSSCRTECKCANMKWVPGTTKSRQIHTSASASGLRSGQLSRWVCALPQRAARRSRPSQQRLRVPWLTEGTRQWPWLVRTPSPLPSTAAPASSPPSPVRSRLSPSSFSTLYPPP